MRVLYAKTNYGQEEKNAVLKVLDDGWLGDGRKVAEFENAVKSFVGKKYAIAVSSGSMANYLAFAALGLPGNSEVITPALTFNTVVSPLVLHRLIPRFVDVDPGVYTLDVRRVKEAFVPDVTRAVMAPHLIGNTAEIAEIAAFCREKNIYLIEDCCDTLGTKYQDQVVGSFGDISTFSFYASHHITAAGGGGMILTDDGELYEKIVSLRDWGRGDVYNPATDQKIVEDIDRRFSVELGGVPYDIKFFYKYLGLNAKMIEIQGAFGVEQMKKLEDFNYRRAWNFDTLRRLLVKHEDKFILPQSRPNSLPSWLAFPLIVKDGVPFKRKDLVVFLEKNGIQTRMIFSGNITAHAPYEQFAGQGPFPGADLVMRGGFLVGAHHAMNYDDCVYIAGKIDEFISNL